MSLEATATKEEVKTPSSVGEAISMFQQDQARAAAAEKQTEAESAAEKTAEAKSPESTPADKGSEAGKPETEAEGQKPSLRLVDEKGNERPFVFKANGKEISESDLNKVLEYAGYGYHASQRLEALNAKEKLFNEQLPIVEALFQAQKEGRLIIKDAAAPGEAEAGKKEPEAEEDVYVDPKVKELEGRLKKTEEEVKKTSGLFIKEIIDKGYKDLRGQIEAKKAEYPAARETEVWKLLELLDEKTGKPLHDVESAMREAHEKETDYLMAAPLPEKRTQQIISDYLAQKAKAEAAPVGSPAGAAPGVASATAAEEKKPITGVTDAIERFKREMASKGGSPSQF